MDRERMVVGGLLIIVSLVGIYRKDWIAAHSGIGQWLAEKLEPERAGTLFGGLFLLLLFVGIGIFSGTIGAR